MPRRLTNRFRPRAGFPKARRKRAAFELHRKAALLIPQLWQAATLKQNYRLTHSRHFVSPTGGPSNGASSLRRFRQLKGVRPEASIFLCRSTEVPGCNRKTSTVEGNRDLILALLKDGQE